jgi:plasmid segregation protein ParM
MEYEDTPQREERDVLAHRRRRIGVDPGFGGFKVSELQADGIRVEITPAVVGVGKKEMGSLGLPTLGSRPSTDKPLRVSYEGVEYLVGQNIHLYAQPVQRLDFLRLSEGPELRSLIYAALWPILGGGSQQVALVIGLPIQILLDQGQAEDVLQKLKSWLLAKHVFRVNDQSAEVTISQIQVVPQVMGTYYVCLAGKNDSLRPAGPNVRFGIADIGFNTLDLIGIEGGAAIDRFTGGSTLGMRRAAEIVLNAVREEVDVELSLQQADDLIVQACKGQRSVIYHPEGETDVTRMVQQALDNAAASVCSFVERVWGNGRQFRHILLTGGGARALQEYLLKLYPYATLIRDPITANARGLAHWASLFSAYQQ